MEKKLSREEESEFNKQLSFEESPAFVESLRDFKITNIGDAILIGGGCEGTIRLDGSLEFLSTPNGMLSLLYSQNRKDLCAAYLPGIDVIRIGYRAVRELEKSPEAVGRIFSHEACHLRFFRYSPNNQRKLTDLLQYDPDRIKKLIEMFYSSKIGSSYSDHHDADASLPELIVGATKSGLRDSRKYKRQNGESIRIGNFATELFAYMSPLFLPNADKEFAEEVKSYRENFDEKTFFGLIPKLLQTILAKAKPDEISLFKNLFIDANPKSIAKFQEAIRRAGQRVRKQT